MSTERVTDGNERSRTLEEEKAMTKHTTGTREEWLAARLELLEAEKELTRRNDQLARRRQELPWVRIDKVYSFETDEGKASLVDLFRGRSQLLVYHFMFGPDYKAGCPSCSAIADGFNGFTMHLANHDVMLCAVSRAPLAKLQAYKRRMGWTFPWASSFGSDFNPDFNVWFTEEQQREGLIEYNYQRETALQSGRSEVSEMPSRTTPDGPVAAMTGTDVATYTRERPGMSAFVLEDGAVYHSYSTYARGLDGLWGAYQWLDRAPKGRNEPDYWWRRHDEYANDKAGAR
ncbi:MAG: thioredoxin family protein [Woeseia sp.]